MFRAAAIIAPLLLLVAHLGESVPASAANVVFTVWMTPPSKGGSDANTGTSRTDGVVTLRRVQKILCPITPCVGKGLPVEVRIVPGTYPAGSNTWSYFDDMHTTSFMPADYRQGWTWAEVAAAGGRPIFDGHGAEWGLVVRPARQSATGRTNLAFHYIEWRNYAHGAIYLLGHGASPLTSDIRLGGNTIYGNYFTRIGNWWDPSLPSGYGAIFTNRTDKSVYRNNHFVDIVNKPGSQGHEHAVYLWYSRENLVTGNRFENVAGDPIRVRNKASHNTISDNNFVNTGGFGYIGDWYCMPTATNCAPVEYRSWANLFRSNTLKGLYKGGWAGGRVDFCYDLKGDCPDDRIKVIP